MTNSIVPSITDEQLAELEAALLDADDDYPLKDLWMALVNRLRAAEADAKRYRWLRERVGVDHAYGEFMPWLPTGPSLLTEQEQEDSEQAIDAAMEAQP